MPCSVTYKNAEPEIGADLLTNPEFQATRDFAIMMDERDPLAIYRDRFSFPRSANGDNSIYLCTHSLGLQPKTARKYVEQELDDWARLAVGGHFRSPDPWISYQRLLAEKTSTLVGAQPHEIVWMNSLTVNLHMMMVSFYRPTRHRHKIVIESRAFPSDQYAVQSQIRFHGFDPATSLVELSPRPGEFCLRDDHIESLIDREGDSIALILLAGVNYFTGQTFDFERITRAGHAKGCTVGFDMAHAAGNLILKLHDWGPDFAVWCSYKYLNGGPGCVGGCFVHERHAQQRSLPRFAGWWGEEETIRFKMEPDFQPMVGAEGWQVSNQPILLLAALRASMDIFDEVGMQRLRAKSVSLTGYLEFLLEQHRSGKFRIITPREPERRGAQLSLQVPHNARSLCERLTASGVIGDFREPDIFRVAPAPLYNSYQDVYQFTQRLQAALG
jgi:kynureninase